MLTLKAQPDAKKLLPERLHRYLTERIVVSGWYPERDYWILIETLTKVLDPKVVGADPWRFFARFSAQNDIGGSNAAASASVKAASAGVYRTYAAAGAQDPQGFFRRAEKIWSQYHDTGSLVVIGGHVKTNSLVMRLMGFHIPLDGFVRLQGYYLEEFGALVGLPLSAKVTRSTAKRDPFCEWEITLERSERTEAYVASLPPL
ncbi:MAG TPA: hypothetical protein VHU80_19025 [Polyangiaceae bacterium]|nr:hypothetical protein [Polyangiaceae bacterium]